MSNLCNIQEVKNPLEEGHDMKTMLTDNGRLLYTALTQSQSVLDFLYREELPLPDYTETESMFDELDIQRNEINILLDRIMRIKRMLGA